MSSPVIRVENLSKSYLIGHQAEQERYTALRDVFGRQLKSFARKAGDLLRGRPIIQGDKIEEFWALKDVSFEVQQGEVLGIIGRNGAGKSTLLRLLADITQPDVGLIERANVRASLLTLRVGFLPHLSGRENAILGGMVLGLHRKEAKERLPRILEFADLGEFIEQPLRTYSSGMKARLGFSVAFAVDPDILLVDEVLGVGDVEFKARSTEMMREKIKSDKTVVLVSHSTSLIKDLCDRVVWIEGGVSRAEGPTEEVMKEYHAFMKSLAKKKAAG